MAFLIMIGGDELKASHVLPVLLSLHLASSLARCTCVDNLEKDRNVNLMITVAPKENPNLIH